MVFNAHGLALMRPFLTIAGWVDEHGPLITFRSGLRNLVVIGRYKAAMDIMDNQGAALADRPRIYISTYMTILPGSLQLVQIGIHRHGPDSLGLPAHPRFYTTVG
ncbi:uncharacterized protein HD556DRAFT_455835 [Suillus plorans]|uniref:Uncharacterized protein n=1 Tax=Suillus plorans TaxID=116603 RepID=A0A9P7AS26_9AGAM|nr:uncharacterized protein HD556DRAFT_455835 [Suillus plorans]KAG1793930.1 hypothetical protein HD556DRAFT_455835 [Suillus plorans]